MGKQIAVKLSREKEIEFNEFLKSKNCVFLDDLSKTKKLNILKRIPPAQPHFWTIYLWNKEFNMKPDFIEIKKEYLYRTGGKGRYVFNKTGKPVIEYSRGPISRIYWEKYFITNSPEYDIEKFEKWYNEVVMWIKKNCKYKNGVYVEWTFYLGDHYNDCEK